MRKKHFLIAAAAFLGVAFSPPLSAAEDTSSIEVDLSVVSNYVFRGADVFQSYYEQKQKSYGSFNAPGAFQPSITFGTPVDGLSFNLWGSFALSGRGDADVDQILQQGPGGANLLNEPGNSPSDPIGAIVGTLPVPGDDLTQFEYPACLQTSTCLGKTYKEENGLKRYDELDFTIDYSKETRKGTMGFGIVTYVSPQTNGKNDYGSITEMYVKYALPSLPELTLAAYTNIDASDKYQYYNLGYERELEISKDMALGLAVGAGYQVQEQLQGWKDVTGGITLSVQNFSLGIHVAHRPDMRFYDSDPNTTMPVWLQGGSNARDGQVADPSRINGPVNSFVNDAISQAVGSTYTPRKKLPSNIYWINAGYTIEI